MWLTVLVLAIAVNFEPARPTLVPLMLARPRPIVQLVALFVGSFGTGLIAGLLILFVFHQTPLGSDRTNGARIQIAIGLTALVVAAITASNLSWRRRPTPELVAAPASAGGDGEGKQRPMDKIAEHARSVLRRGNSPWLSCLLGMGVGLPSVDYLAVLVVIGSSGASATAQLIALVLFLIVGNVFIAIPLTTYILAPERTKAWIQRFQIWIRARTRRQLAAVIAAVGVIQILLGASALWPLW
jgi:hypothetical protein